MGREGFTIMNTQMWVKVSLMTAAVISFFIFEQLLDIIWDSMALPMFDEWGVTPVQLISVAMAGALFWVLNKNIKVSNFMSEVVVELSKVTWPVRKETLMSAVIVVVMVGIASLILFVFDSLWATLTQKLLNV